MKNEIDELQHEQLLELRARREERRAIYEAAAKVGVATAAVDRFRADAGRWPTEFELPFVEKGTATAITLGVTAPRPGTPNRRVSICIPNVWRPSIPQNAPGVSIYAELAVNAKGTITGAFSLRYHDGDDSTYPSRGPDGKLERSLANATSDGKHLIRSRAFRAKHRNSDDIAKSPWPRRQDGEEFEMTMSPERMGLWHLSTFIWPVVREMVGRPLANFQHLVVDAPAEIAAPPPPQTRVDELENENDELRAQLEGVLR